VGVLQAESQPLTDMLCAVVRANIPAVMEAVGRVLLMVMQNSVIDNKCEGGSNSDSSSDGNDGSDLTEHHHHTGASQSRSPRLGLKKETHLEVGVGIGLVEHDKGFAGIVLSTDEAKSLRLVMYCLRALCVMCRRVPNQIQPQAESLMMVTLQVYLVLLPLPDAYKMGTDGVGSSSSSSSSSIEGGGRGNMKQGMMSPLPNTISGSGDDVCRCYCRCLWTSLSTACQALRLTCPDQWEYVTTSLAKHSPDIGINSGTKLHVFP
jgi:hypothetical protein